MVTGASTADLSLVLVDARAGVVEQSKRHAYIASLLRIPHLVVCVNKMDLVDWSEERFEEIREEFTDFAAGLDFEDILFVPISALLGDNVVDRSENMPWYEGPALLDHLEHVEMASDRNFEDAALPGAVGRAPAAGRAPRLPRLRRPGGRRRADARATRSWCCRPGARTRIAAIDTYDGELDAAYPPMSVTLLLEDDLDLGRGDMLVGADDAPEPVRELTADVCWMADAPLRAARALRDQAHHPHRPRGRRGGRAPRRRPHARARGRPTSSG